MGFGGWVSGVGIGVRGPGSPVELVDVLDVPEQSTHLLRTDQEITLIDDVSQVILQRGEQLSQSAARRAAAVIAQTVQQVAG